MGTIIKWPIEFSHHQDHQRMHTNLVEILQDFKATCQKYNYEDVPRTEKGDINWDNISVKQLALWLIANAQELKHEHDPPKDEE